MLYVLQTRGTSGIDRPTFSWIQSAAGIHGQRPDILNEVVLCTAASVTVSILVLLTHQKTNQSTVRLHSAP